MAALVPFLRFSNSVGHWEKELIKRLTLICIFLESTHTDLLFARKESYFSSSSVASLILVMLLLIDLVTLGT